MYAFYGKFNIKHKIDWKVDWTRIAPIDDMILIYFAVAFHVCCFTYFSVFTSNINGIISLSLLPSKCGSELCYRVHGTAVQ